MAIVILPAAARAGVDVKETPTVVLQTTNAAVAGEGRIDCTRAALDTEVDGFAIEVIALTGAAGGLVLAAATAGGRDGHGPEGPDNVTEYAPEAGGSTVAGGLPGDAAGDATIAATGAATGAAAAVDATRVITLFRGLVFFVRTGRAEV